MIYESPYGKVHYDVYGEKDAPAIVFIHGLGADSRCFIKQAAHFRRNHRVVVFDLPNHGRSFRMHGRFDYDVATAVLLGLLETLGIERCSVVGVSMGGHLAQYAGNAAPECFDAVVDVGSTPLHRRLPRLTFYRLYAILLVSYLLPITLLIKMIAGKDRGKTEASQDYIIRRMAGRAGKRDILSMAKVMVRNARRGIGKPIRQPLLIIHGENDQKAVRIAAERWHASIPDSRYHIIPRAGHVANQDNARRFNEVLETFLAAVRKNEEANHVQEKTA